MKNERNKKSAVIAVIIIILIILIAISLSILYFFTDTFKTKKEIYSKNFMSFFAQNEQNGSKLTEYFNKKATSAHTNNGSLKTNIELSSDEYQDYIKPVNDMKIVFSGSTNPSQKQTEQNIEIQYSDDIVFPINYLRDNDLYGLQNEYISNKYIAIENNNLKKFFEKLGLTNTEELPDKIEITNQNQDISYTEEEIKSLQEKYSPLLDIITDEKITVEKTDNITKYTLKTTLQELKDTLVQFLEILKDDDITLNKINSILEGYDITIEKEKIEEIIQNIQEQEIESEDISISINVQNGIPISIDIESQEATISLNKESKKDEATFSLDITSKTQESDKSTQPSTFSLKAQYTGLATDNISEKYTVSFGTEGEETLKYEYNLENQIAFTDQVQIDNLTSDNAMILNDYSQEQITNLMTAVGNRILEINEDQMQQLGVQYPPILMMTPLGFLATVIGNTAQDAIVDEIYLNDGENNTTDMVKFGEEIKNVDEDETRKNRTASGKETIMLEYNKCLTNYYANKYQNGEEGTNESLIEYILNNIQSTEANEYITEIKENEMITNLKDENGNIITATVAENGKIIWSDDNK